MLVINGHEYGLAYTIGAAVAINDLYPDGAPKGLRSGKYILDMALIMSNEFENRKKLDDPTYEKKPLDKALLYSLDFSERESVTSEVNAAYMLGSKRTVLTEEPKKTNGGAQK